MHTSAADARPVAAPTAALRRDLRRRLPSALHPLLPDHAGVLPRRCRRGSTPAAWWWSTSATPSSGELERVLAATRRRGRSPTSAATPSSKTNVLRRASGDPSTRRLIRGGDARRRPTCARSAAARRAAGPAWSGGAVYTDDRAPVEWLIDSSLFGYATRRAERRGDSEESSMWPELTPRVPPAHSRRRVGPRSSARMVDVIGAKCGRRHMWRRAELGWRLDPEWGNREVEQLGVPGEQDEIVAAVAAAKQSPSAIEARALRRAASIIRAGREVRGEARAQEAERLVGGVPAVVALQAVVHLDQVDPAHHRTRLDQIRHPRGRGLLTVEPGQIATRPGTRSWRLGGLVVERARVEARGHRGSRARSSSRRPAMPPRANRPARPRGSRRGRSTI